MACGAAPPSELIVYHHLASCTTNYRAVLLKKEKRGSIDGKGGAKATRWRMGHVIRTGASYIRWNNFVIGHQVKRFTDARPEHMQRVSMYTPMSCKHCSTKATCTFSRRHSHQAATVFDRGRLRAGKANLGTPSFMMSHGGMNGGATALVHQHLLATAFWAPRENTLAAVKACEWPAAGLHKKPVPGLHPAEVIRFPPSL